jgi:hypothetical protein
VRVRIRACTPAGHADGTASSIDPSRGAAPAKIGVPPPVNDPGFPITSPAPSRKRTAAARTIAPTRVPQTRFGRLASVAMAAGELAIGGAAGGIRRLLAGRAAGATEAASAFLSAGNARRLARGWRACAAGR